ncbi:MAG: D-alanine--D-alanine ligase [Patescibacteria group bacterium]
MKKKSVKVKKKIHISLISGGPSREHEVSVRTARVIAKNLDKNRYSLTRIFISKTGVWKFPDSAKKFDHLDAVTYLKKKVCPDIAFIALHGTFGEDGTIQTLFDSVGIRYTGSGVLASTLAMDKCASLALYKYAGLRVPKTILLSPHSLSHSQEAVEEAKAFGMPCVVKPADSGSSVGVSIVKSLDEIAPALVKAQESSSRIIVQEYIQGDEVTCAVLDEHEGAIALPPTHIIPQSSAFFDYHAKYTKGATQEITPPQLPAKVIDKIQESALVAHHLLGCRGISRTDMLVRAGKIYMLETNTIPGMTETSLYPQAAAAVGITFPQLLNKIIETARTR